MDLWELAAREEIRDTIARYAWCGEFMDSAGFGALFTPDAVLEIKGGATYRGREEIVGMIAGVRDRTRATAAAAPSESPPVMRHFVANVRIELESRQRARAHAYFTVFMPPHGHDHWGRYSDELALGADGRWQFARRRVSVDGAVAASRMWPIR
jgi:hypothetical protein